MLPQSLAAPVLPSQGNAMIARPAAPPPSVITTLAQRWVTPLDEVSRPPEPAELSVTNIAHGKWCVRDDRYRTEDAKGLLGFIEEIGGEETVFEVMALHGGFEWCSYSSFNDAVESFLKPPHPRVSR